MLIFLSYTFKGCLYSTVNFFSSDERERNHPITDAETDQESSSLHDEVTVYTQAWIPFIPSFIEQNIHDLLAWLYLCVAGGVLRSETQPSWFMCGHQQRVLPGNNAEHKNRNSGGCEYVFLYLNSHVIWCRCVLFICLLSVNIFHIGCTIKIQTCFSFNVTEALSKVFTRLGFTMVVHNNLTAGAMRHELKELGKNNFLDHDALVGNDTQLS